MLPLDPLKLAIIAVVALVVLGPDKLPAAARKVASVWSDVRNFQSSIQSEVHGVISEMPFAESLSAPGSIGVSDLAGRARHALTAAVDPRQALYRSIGLTDTDARAPSSHDAGDQPVVGVDGVDGRGPRPLTGSLTPTTTSPESSMPLLLGDPSTN